MRFTTAVLALAAASAWNVVDAFSGTPATFLTSSRSAGRRVALIPRTTSILRSNYLDSLSPTVADSLTAPAQPPAASEEFVLPSLRWKYSDGTGEPWKGLQATYSRQPFDEARLEQAIADLQQQYATSTPIEDPLKELTIGDSCIVNMVGYMALGDGVSKGNRLSATADVEVFLGKGGYMDGLVEGLIGAKVGETRTINVKFPESLKDSSMAGKPAIFDVTVKSAASVSLPPLDDSFASQVYPGTTFAALVSELRSSIDDDIAAEIKEARNIALASALADRLDVECPQAILTAQARERYTKTMTEMRDNGTPDSEIRALISPDHFERFKEIYRKDIERDFAVALAVDEIAASSGIVPAAADIDAMVTAYEAQELGLSPEAIRKRAEDAVSKGMVFDMLAQYADLTVVDDVGGVAEVAEDKSLSSFAAAGPPPAMPPSPPSGGLPSDLKEIEARSMATMGRLEALTSKYRQTAQETEEKYANAASRVAEMQKTYDETKLKIAETKQFAQSMVTKFDSAVAQLEEAIKMCQKAKLLEQEAEAKYGSFFREYESMEAEYEMARREAEQMARSYEEACETLEQVDIDYERALEVIKRSYDKSPSLMDAPSASAVAVPPPPPPVVSAPPVVEPPVEVAPPTDEELKEKALEEARLKAEEEAKAAAALEARIAARRAAEKAAAAEVAALQVAEDDSTRRAFGFLTVLAAIGTPLTKQYLDQQAAQQEGLTPADIVAVLKGRGWEAEIVTAASVSSLVPVSPTGLLKCVDGRAGDQPAQQDGPKLLGGVYGIAATRGVTDIEGLKKIVEEVKLAGNIPSVHGDDHAMPGTMGCGFYKLWSKGKLEGFALPEFNSEEGKAAILEAGGVYEKLGGDHAEKVVYINFVPGTTRPANADDQAFMVDAWVAQKYGLDIPKYLIAAASTVEQLKGPLNAKLIVPN